ncbi:SRPBCC family protein [Streptomyces sp. NPDC056527]|uniref:SRPBCC family protein n=1 Tax=Streptomyces sp. NPDC056527 TaxID=3345853 RepID=UPI0036A258BA
MTTSILDSRPLFELGAEIHIAASADKIYSIVSDMQRHSEWSSELQGGRWLSGEPGKVGSIFEGENFRSDDIVSWAPLIRGIWHTKSEVAETTPGRVFRWKIHSKTGEPQELTWSFLIEPTENGATLSQTFRMGYASPGIHEITKDMNEADKQKFISDWMAKMTRDVTETLGRIKVVVEKD